MADQRSVGAEHVDCASTERLLVGVVPTGRISDEELTSDVGDIERRETGREVRVEETPS